VLLENSRTSLSASKIEIEEFEMPQPFKNVLLALQSDALNLTMNLIQEHNKISSDIFMKELELLQVKVKDFDEIWNVFKNILPSIKSTTVIPTLLSESKFP
jgi:hypothetical protein